MVGNRWQETNKQRATHQTAKAVVVFGHATKIFESLNIS